MIFRTHQIPFGTKFVCVSVLCNHTVRCKDRVVGVGVSECVWSAGGMTLTGEPEVLAEKPVPPSLYPAQLLHGLSCDRTSLLAQETGNRLPEP